MTMYTADIKTTNATLQRDSRALVKVQKKWISTAAMIGRRGYFRTCEQGSGSVSLVSAAMLKSSSQMAGNLPISHQPDIHETP